MVTTRNERFNFKIYPFSLQDVFNIVGITTNRVEITAYSTQVEQEEREKEIRSRDVVRGTALIITGRNQKNSLLSRIPGNSRSSSWLRCRLEGR